VSRPDLHAVQHNPPIAVRVVARVEDGPTKRVRDCKDTPARKEQAMPLSRRREESRAIRAGTISNAKASVAPKARILPRVIAGPLIIQLRLVGCTSTMMPFTGVRILCEIEEPFHDNSRGGRLNFGPWEHSEPA
jgi:hypothetical protein